MKKISIQSLNSLFNFIHEIPSMVLWIRDVTFNKQIYVSENYEKIWGHSLEKLYNFPQSFEETIISKDKKIYYDSLRDKININTNEKSEEDKTYFWRVKQKNSKVIYAEDHHCLLINNENQPVGFVGFAKLISQKEWLKCASNIKPEESKNNIADIKKNVFDILKKELQLYKKIASSDKSQPLDFISLIHLTALKSSARLTAQEIVCLSYLLQGMPSKHIALRMNLSIRTVEFHLENIRKKFNCRTKVQLISKIMRCSQNS